MAKKPTPDADGDRSDGTDDAMELHGEGARAAVAPTG